MNKLNWTVQLSNDEWELIWLGYWLLTNDSTGWEINIDNTDDFRNVCEKFNISNQKEKESLYKILHVLNYILNNMIDYERKNE